MPRVPVTALIHTLQRARLHRGLRSLGRVGGRDLPDRLLLDRRHGRAGPREVSPASASSSANTSAPRRRRTTRSTAPRTTGSSSSMPTSASRRSCATRSCARSKVRSTSGPTRSAGLNFMLGKPVRFSGLQRDRVTRLFHRGHARYPNKRVHADLLVDGATGRLEHKMDHFYIRTFDHMIAKMTRYANWGAAQMFIDGKTTSSVGIIAHPDRQVRPRLHRQPRLPRRNARPDLRRHARLLHVLEVREAVGAHAAQEPRQAGPAAEAR